MIYPTNAGKSIFELLPKIESMSISDTSEKEHSKFGHGWECRELPCEKLITDVEQEDWEKATGMSSSDLSLASLKKYFGPGELPL